MTFNELANLFLYELEEELGEYSESLSKYEQDKSIDNINDMYINIHTIKGSSKTLLHSMDNNNEEIKTLIDYIATLTHKFENFLDYLKKNNYDSESNLRLFFDFETIISELKNCIYEGAQYQNKPNYNAFLKELHSLENGTVDDSINNKDSLNRLFFRVSLSFDKKEDEEFKHGYLNIVYRDIQNKYSNSTFIPTLEQLLKGEEFSTDNILIQIESEDDAIQVKEFLQELDNIGLVEEIPFTPSTNTFINNNEPNNIKTETKKPVVTSEQNIKHSHPLRIETKRIDNVLKHTSKLVILKNKFNQFLIENDFLTGTGKRKELEDIFNDINVHVDYLQESVLEIRMTPLHQLFTRFPKDIRALSKETGKPIKFTTSGGAVEIDKSILDELFEPFMHLIRNSIIHGIENPETRKAKGKDPEGTIDINARHDKNRVIITITDDGKGIDLETIKQVAIQREFVTKSQANNMNNNELLGLIFKSGISTANEVNDYSGRGIGMDAVRKKIEAINGNIDVITFDDIGTTITLFLPLTTAIIEGMITKINNEYFTFPVSQVEEVIIIPKTDIRSSKNKKFIFHKDTEIPIIYSELFFDFKKEDNNDPFEKIILLRSQNNVIGLSIDEFLGQQSIVVKNLHPFTQKARGISACNILGDGSISLIVDTNDLLPFLSQL